MALIVHISDFHVGSISFQEDLLLQSMDIINDMAPDVTIITGDLTENGYYMEMEQAAQYIEMIKSPVMVVPGNHDARHVGDQCFRELIRERYGNLQILDGLKIMGKWEGLSKHGWRTNLKMLLAMICKKSLPCTTI